MKNKSELSPDQAEDYIRLLTKHEKVISKYVIIIVPNLSDAEDIIQNVKLIMWQKFNGYEKGSNFLAWARKIAFYTILDFRKRKGRERKVIQFSDSFYDLIDNHVGIEDDKPIERLSHLQNCVQKLKPEHQHLIHLRYVDQQSIEQISKHTGQSLAAIYKSIKRVRISLKYCITKKLSPSI